MTSAAREVVVDRSRLLHAADAIGDDLSRRTVRCRDGSLGWLAPATSTGASPTVLGPFLYGGSMGCALFLAALVRTSSAPDLRALCLESIAPLRQRFRYLVADQEHPSRKRLGLGGFTGLGGILYAFLRIGEWLDEPELRREAGDVVSLITPELIRLDERFDVVDGCAGTILALLVVAGLETVSSRRRVAIETASECARHLLAHRRPNRGGPRAWATPGRPPLAGFAHGAGGISYALLRLYSHTGEDELRQAAEEGMAYERTLYDPRHRNWRDLRFSQPQYQCSWCHGAPGIALSRAGVVGVLSNSTLTEELAVAVETTRTLADSPIDHLCCGNLGRADILYTTGRILRDGTLIQDALKLAERVLDRAERKGHFGLTSPAQPCQFDPSLFRGMAGIGFALLRLASDDVLPSPLRLE